MSDPKTTWERGVNGAARAHQERAAAFIGAMHSMKGQLGGFPSDPADFRVAALREQYARGWISLGQLEAEVEVALRSAR